MRLRPFFLLFRKPEPGKFLVKIENEKEKMSRSRDPLKRKNGSARVIQAQKTSPVNRFPQVPGVIR